MKTLKKEIESGKIKNLYIFDGDEEYLKKYYSNLLIKKLVKDDFKMMNYDIFEGKDVSASNICDAFSTLPFMSEYRVCVIKNSGLFDKGKKEDSEFLFKNIEYLPKTSVVIFIEDKIDKRGKLFKKVKDLGRFVEIKTPNEADLIIWVKKLLNDKNKDISSETSRYFLRYVAHDMNNIVSEIEKISIYNNNSVITEDTINEICTKSLDTKIFDLVYAVGNKRTDLAINIYNNLIFYKEQPLMILYLLSRQFRLILQCNFLNSKGYSQSEIGKNLSLRDFAVKEYLNQSKNFNTNLLINALRECLKCDIDIKTGLIKDEIGVLLLIIKYST